jgi:hypothetical protein
MGPICAADGWAAARNASLTFCPNIEPCAAARKPDDQRRRAKNAPNGKAQGNGVHPVLHSMGEALTAGAMCRVRSAARTALPLLALFAGELHATLLRVFIYACAVGVLGLGVTEFVTRSRGAVAALPAPQQEWVTVARPLAAFALSIPEVSETPHYAIQRHVSGVGRKDVFTFGDLTAGASATVEIHRPGAEAEHPGDVDTTASIPGLRLSQKTDAPDTIDTKFGPVTLNEFTERTPDGTRRCLRFARAFEDPRLTISGTFCNAGVELVDRGIIVCALDRLTLLSAASEPKIGALFARAEFKRSFCGQNSVFVAATPKRTDWIEASRDPKMRGRQ